MCDEILNMDSGRHRRLGSNTALEPAPKGVGLVPLRRKPPFNIPSLAARLHSGIASTVKQIEPFAQKWDDNNADALETLTDSDEHKVWLILGDSLSQGIGAQNWQDGWVNKAQKRLAAQSCSKWVLINLSMSGGRFSDVTGLQLPAFNNLGVKAHLVTCIVGGNDLMWRVNNRAVLDDAHELTKALEKMARGDTKTIVSTMPGKGSRPKHINRQLELAADKYDNFNLVDIWEWTRADNATCKDHIHPTTLGYEMITEVMWPAIRQHTGCTQQTATNSGQ